MIEIRTIDDPTLEDIARVERAGSPISKIDPADFEKYRGCLVALLCEGGERGKVIAHAPINHDDPRQPREEIERQVQQSPYKDQRYVAHQILA